MTLETSTLASQVCSICRDRLNNPVASLSNCCHKYHFECIKSWVKIGSNSCPLCKKCIKYIKSGNKQVKVTPKKQTCQSQIDDLTNHAIEQALLEQEEERSYCEICHLTDDLYNPLLICDDCDGNIGGYYHPLCVNLKGVPENNWYCPHCISIRENKNRKKYKSNNKNRRNNDNEFISQNDDFNCYTSIRNRRNKRNTRNNNNKRINSFSWISTKRDDGPFCSDSDEYKPDDDYYSEEEYNFDDDSYSSDIDFSIDDDSSDIESKHNKQRQSINKNNKKNNKKERNKRKRKLNEKDSTNELNKLVRSRSKRRRLNNTNNNNNNLDRFRLNNNSNNSLNNTLSRGTTKNKNESLNSLTTNDSKNKRLQMKRLRIGETNITNNNNNNNNNKRRLKCKYTSEDSDDLFGSGNESSVSENFDCEKNSWKCSECSLINSYPNSRCNGCGNSNNKNNNLSSSLFANSVFGNKNKNNNNNNINTIDKYFINKKIKKDNFDISSISSNSSISLTLELSDNDDNILIVTKKKNNKNKNNKKTNCKMAPLNLLAVNTFSEEESLLDESDYFHSKPKRKVPIIE